MSPVHNALMFTPLSSIVHAQCYLIGCILSPLDVIEQNAFCSVETYLKLRNLNAYFGSTILNVTLPIKIGRCLTGSCALF